MMYTAYLIDAVRSPIGKYGSGLSSVRSDDLAAHTINKLISRNLSVDTASIDDVILGCANQSGEDNRNVARMALLLAGLPYTVPGETVNRLCASGMSAVIHASRAIQSGDGKLFIAGGVENMTRAPYVISKSPEPYGRDAKIFDTSIGWRFINPKMKAMYGTDSMGETAENVAELYKINRTDQDAFAWRSQMKAANAQKSGRFNQEIVPVEIPARKGASIHFNADEFIKPDTTPEILARLKPAFREGGTVTAGNSSGINDGAAVLLLASEEAVEKYNLSPKVRIVSSAVVGTEPRLMGMGPVEASQMALRKAGLTFADISVIELNEAFASQCLACIRQWKLSDEDPRINPNGGAIALGHPLGMSGARLILTASVELQLKKLRYALCTMCVGVGQGYAVILKNVSIGQ